MKICDIVQSYSPRSGGVKRYITNKMGYFTEKPDVSHILIVPAPRDRTRYEYHTKIYEIKSPFLYGSVDYRLLMSLRRILEVIRRETPDIIEVDSAYVSAWIALKAGNRMNIPVVAFYHSEYPRKLADKVREYIPRMLSDRLSDWINAYVRNLYNRMDTTFVATKSFQSLLEKIGVKGLVQVPLGVNIRDFYPRNCRESVFRKLGLSPETRLLFYAGRLAGMKNIDSLIKMMDILKNNEFSCHLLIAGDGELRDEIAPTAENRDDITLYPYIQDRNNLAQYYSGADLFVHAGTMETFGLVSLEAQACGTRVVAVRNGGIDSTLEGENPLIMAENEKPESLAEAVQKALELYETTEDKMARRKRIVEHFSWESTFEKLLAHYRKTGEKRE